MEGMHEIEMHEGGGGNAVRDVEHNSFGDMAETETERAEGITAVDVETIELSDSADTVTKIEQVVGQHGLHNLIESLNDLDDTKSLTIFRVPAYFREKSKALYEPRMVSIGPFHHGKNELRMMEEHKRRCLCDFLRRNKKISIENYYQEMRNLETKARQHYSESIKMDSNQFVIMLLLDGCFILEYFLKWRDSVADSLCDAPWNKIKTDIIMLENQIPFFVIHKLAYLLWDLIDKPNCGRMCPLLDLIFPHLPKNEKLMLRKPQISCGEVDHLLHYYHKCLVLEHHHEQYFSSHCTQPLSMKTQCLSWFWSRLPSLSKLDSRTYVFPCATVLKDSGVTFRRKPNPRDIFDITFHKGVMEIPLLKVDGSVKIIFTNLTAFEQSQAKGSNFTRFVVLMDFLIDTKDDVSLLKECGVMESLLQNDEEAAYFFNTLANECRFNFEPHHYANLVSKVHNYSNSTWPKYRAKLMHDYFSNPWTSISVFAGMLLLGLTITQTYYTIYSAYHH